LKKPNPLDASPPVVHKGKEMKTTEQDVYIKILKYANEHPNFTYQQISDEFPEQKQLIGKEILRKQIIYGASVSDQYMLTFEGRMLLLEYEELNEARKSSRTAMIIAIISILLTFFSILYTSFSVLKVEVINTKDTFKIINK
jgi:hypothetical protein